MAETQKSSATDEPGLPANLIYVSDEEPGFRRKRAGRGFYYVAPDGNRLGDEAHIQRIRSLAIPPAYENVWITTEPLGHMQATGRDQRGRKQYRYHPLWHEHRDQTKYGDLVRFAELLPVIRETVDRDLRRRSLSREKVSASVVWMLDNLLIRIGNDRYAKENKSFGLTTLRKKHIDISGSVMKFRFKGKSGKEWNLSHTDRRIARVIRDVHDLPGQHLFKYEDEDGGRHPVRSQDINLYLREITGADISSKLFRTWAGTTLAAHLLAGTEPPQSTTDGKRKINAVIDAVSHRLGNTRAVCRRSYIHPRVISAFEDGQFTESFAGIRPTRAKWADWLDEEEKRLFGWLQTQSA